MQQSEDGQKNSQQTKLVKLRVSGTELPVNTIHDDKGDGRISLVCPFPALELEIPVQFSGHEGSGMQEGTLHRITVEEDRETGLPRLKLSIEPGPGPTTDVAEQPSPTRRYKLADTSGNKSQDLDQPDTITDIPLNKGIIDQEEDSPPRHRYAESDYEDFGDLPNMRNSDPAWIDCSDIPSPDQFAQRAQTRRRHRLAKRAAVLACLTVLVAGGYFAEQTGFINVNTIRSHIAGFSIDQIMPGRQVAPALLSTPPREQIAEHLMEEAAAEKAANLDPHRSDGLSAAESTAADNEPPSPEKTPPEVNPNVVAAALNQDDASQVPAAETAEPNAEPIAPAPEESATDQTINDVTLLLPTRWPVEYISSYRVRNPAGVVVDVPGGLVRREGYLEYLAKHPMVRSVKSIQRETGARFIVFVHGEDLPRFITSPKTTGVSLRLYQSEDQASSEVALLD